MSALRRLYNRSVHVFELTEALSEIPGAQVAVRRGALHVHFPALGDTAELDPGEITEASSVFVPTGAPAIQLDVRRGREILPLIVTADDFVFTPAYADSMVLPGAELRVPAMPNLIAYSEMHRDVRALGRTLDTPGASLDPDTLAATLLAHRCFLAGAVRMGLWPIRVAAWWEFSSARSAGQVFLPSFRADPAWDDLMADVADARRASMETAADRP
jgi:hypothetical protein